VAVDGTASITALSPFYAAVYPTARRGGLRGAGGISTDARRAAHLDRGFCPKHCSAAWCMVLPTRDAWSLRGSRPESADRPPWPSG
jgi:hypothetical protein